MAHDLDRILELLQNRELAQARARLDLLDPASMAGWEFGRFRALKIAHLLETGHGSAADELLASSIAEHERNADFLCGFGTTLSSLDRCSDLLQQLAESDSDRIVGALILGLALVRHNRHEEALELLHQALARGAELDRVQLLIRRTIAQCEDALGDSLAAARRYLELLHDYPDQHELWRDLAFCERQGGEPAAAARAMQCYLKVDPENASAWASLGDFQDDAGMVDDAEAAWRRALELDPEDTILYYNWGVAAGRRKDLERVQACADSLRSRNPEDPLALALASILLEAEGDTWRGWEAMREAVDRQRDRNRGLALAHRALLYAERNQLIEPAEGFADELHQRNLLDEDVLEVINRVENRSSNRARDFSVLVDVLPNPAWCAAELMESDGASEARFVRRLRVVAETAEEARRLAVAFERRCGALRVRVGEVKDVGPIAEEDHEGVWRCPETLDDYLGEEPEHN